MTQITRLFAKFVCLKNCVCGFILTNIKSDRTQEWFEFGLAGARDICNRLTNTCNNFDRYVLTACTNLCINLSKVDRREWLTGWQGKTMIWPRSCDLSSGPHEEDDEKKGEGRGLSFFTKSKKNSFFYASPKYGFSVAPLSLFKNWPNLLFFSVIPIDSSRQHTLNSQRS